MSRLCSVVVAFILGLTLLVDATSAQTPGVTRSLFNGKNLDNWIVTGCEVVVENGNLLLKSGNGWVRSHHRYRDFILEVDWKALKAAEYDSGIYIRADMPPAKANWPRKTQINLKQGLEGNLTSIKEAASTGLIKPGEWNHFKVTVIGNSAAMEINGKPAWKTELLDNPNGYVGFQCEEPLGGQFEFKNITITELGYESLSNGKDLSGWEGAGADASLCWLVEDGAIKCDGKKGPWLRSAKEYGDFNFRTEYKLLAGGNSGVFIRVPKDGNHHGPNSGIEVQCLDDADPKYAKLKDYQYSAGLYDFVGPNPRVSRPDGEWNTLEINCVGQRYTITHNGFVVVDAEGDKVPELNKRLLKGYLGLQNHSEAVWFKNVRVGEAVR
jgi:hypothetical protein